MSNNTDTRFYTDNIISHSIKKQQDAEFVGNGVYMIDIDPGQVNVNSYQGLGTRVLLPNYKTIIFNYNLLMVTNDFLMNKITYAKEYSALDFVNITGMEVSIYNSGVKISLSNTTIAVYGLLTIVIKIYDTNNNNSNYSVMIMKNIKAINDLSYHATMALSYSASDIKNKIYFYDGQLYQAPWIIQNGIAAWNVNTVGHTLYEYTLSNVYVNSVMNTIMVNGVPCIELPTSLDTYVSPKSIWYSDQSTIPKLFFNEPVFITHRHFQMPKAGSYYVVIFHDASIGAKVDYPISKFEQLIGPITNYQSEVPSNFYKYDDGLREPSDVPSVEVTDEIKKGFKSFPEMFKTWMTSNYWLNLIDVDPNSYKIYNNNNFLYPTDNKKWETFASPCAYVKVQLGSGAPVIFVDGLVMSPKYMYTDNSVQHLFFNASDIVGKKMTIWNVNSNLTGLNSFTITVKPDMTASIGPNWKLGIECTEFIIVSEDFINHSYAEITGWSVTFADDFAIFTFPPECVGKTYRIYSKDVAYTQFYPKSKTMAFQLPWTLMYNKDDLFIFTNGRMTQNYKIVAPVTQRVLSMVPMGINYMSDTVLGEDVYIVSAPYVNLYEQRDTLNITDGIIELTNKSFPFSKKLFMLFINGKFVHPSDIIEISSYKFGLKNVKSIYNLRIYKLDTPNLDTSYNSLYQQASKDWDSYIDSKTYSQLKTLTGAQDLIDSEAFYDQIDTSSYQYLYEILYKFILTNTTDTCDIDKFTDLLQDFSVLTTNGRIILDGNRNHQQARYIFT